MFCQCVGLPLMFFYFKIQDPYVFFLMVKNSCLSLSLRVFCKVSCNISNCYLGPIPISYSFSFAGSYYI